METEYKPMKLQSTAIPPFVFFCISASFTGLPGRAQQLVQGQAEVATAEKKPPPQKTNYQRLQNYSDYVTFRSGKDGELMPPRPAKFARSQVVAPSTIQNPVQVKASGAETGSLFYLATSKESPSVIQARSREVERLINQRAFEKAYQLEKSVSVQPKVLWHWRYAETNAAPIAFRITDRVDDVWGQPHVSPDGKLVSLLCATTDNLGFTNSDLILMDLGTGSIKQIKCGQGINYDSASWSPDGKYLAFFQGGLPTAEVNFYANDFDAYFPLELWIYDVQKGQISRVSANDTLRGPLSWSRPHQLVYGELPKPAPEGAKKLGGKKPAPPKKPAMPNAYVYDPATKASKLLLEKAYLPICSADGQWIAFYGPEDQTRPPALRDGWRFAPQGLSLCVARSDGTERKALDMTPGLYPQLCWSADNTTLFQVDDLYASPHARAQVLSWEIATGIKRQLTIFGDDDARPHPLHPSQTQFPVVGLSADQRHLLVWRESHPDKQDLNFFRTVLTRIDLQSGKLDDVVDLTGNGYFTWHKSTVP